MAQSSLGPQYLTIKIEPVWSGPDSKPLAWAVLELFWLDPDGDLSNNVFEWSVSPSSCCHGNVSVQLLSLDSLLTDVNGYHLGILQIVCFHECPPTLRLARTCRAHENTQWQMASSSSVFTDLSMNVSSGTLPNLTHASLTNPSIDSSLFLGVGGPSGNFC